MGLGRMVQGGHFLTDVLWAGAITYLAGLVLYYIFRFDSCHPRAGGDPGHT
jgi:lipid A 4'-phosphatase